jgi:hypothetical protein
MSTSCPASISFAKRASSTATTDAHALRRSRLAAVGPALALAAATPTPAWEGTREPARTRQAARAHVAVDHRHADGRRCAVLGEKPVELVDFGVVDRLQRHLGVQPIFADPSEPLRPWRIVDQQVAQQADRFGRVAHALHSAASCMRCAGCCSMELHAATSYSAKPTGRKQTPHGSPDAHGGPIPDAEIGTSISDGAPTHECAVPWQEAA